MKETVLITGVNGYLGKAIINELLNNTPWQIIVQCRERGKCSQFIDHKRIIAVCGNLLQPETFSIK